MTDKVKHDKGEFQLEVPPGLPFGVGGLVKGFIEYLNNVDINHDGKSDVAQSAPFIIKALPVMIELLKLIKPNELKTLLCQSTVVSDPVAAGEHIDQLVEIAEDAAKLAKEAGD